MSSNVSSSFSLKISRNVFLAVRFSLEEEDEVVKRFVMSSSLILLVSHLFIVIQLCIPSTLSLENAVVELSWEGRE